jgi:broad specificity polyphosphatase/5'/3'-nucleotidase SurE
VPEPPLILVTNDDGLGSPGLHAAAEAVADLGDLLLVAPATQQTAMSRAFVTDAGAGVVKCVQMHIAGRAVSGYAITGSPVMAVTHAVLELAERPIRLCVDWDRVEPGTDIHAIVRDQVASVTPLTWQMTAQTDWMPSPPLNAAEA